MFSACGSAFRLRTVAQNSATLPGHHAPERRAHLANHHATERDQESDQRASRWVRIARADGQTIANGAQQRQTGDGHHQFLGMPLASL